MFYFFYLLVHQINQTFEKILYFIFVLFKPVKFVNQQMLEAFLILYETIRISQAIQKIFQTLKAFPIS